MQPAAEREDYCKYPNIEAERAGRRMTQSQVARALGVCVGAYYGWVGGDWPIPSGHLRALCALFRCSPDYLLAPDDSGRRWKRYMRL